MREMNEEISFWKGSPSQWLNIGPFTVCLILTLAIIVGSIFTGPLFPLAIAAVVFPLGYLFWRYLTVRTQIFELTSERLRITKGIINQHIDEVELYRVKDSRMVRSWWMRLTGLASLELETSDRSMPLLVIPAIHGGAELRELLRQHVELQRDRKRVRELDFDDHGADAGDHGDA